MTWLHHPKIRLAANMVHEGGVIAYPTEAVWGLGCEPFNRHAVEKILWLKDRDVSKGLILVAADISQFDFLLHDLSADQREKLEATWPGHHTWLVPHQNRVPEWVSGDFPTVALRVSSHPVVQAICTRVGGPITSTSANPAGAAPATSNYKARCYFYDSVFYAPGRVGSEAKPSQISDLQTGQIIRSA